MRRRGSEREFLGNNRVMVACVVLACVGCHGELVDLWDDGSGDAAMADAAALSGVDANGDMMMTGPRVTYVTSVHSDIVRLGCAQVDACHKGPAGSDARMRVLDEDKRRSYDSVRVFATRGAISELLTYPLNTGEGAKHLGGRKFDNPLDPDYQRWLEWIQLGAPFTDDGGVASGGGDAGVPGDGGQP